MGLTDDSWFFGRLRARNPAKLHGVEQKHPVSWVILASSHLAVARYRLVLTRVSVSDRPILS